MTKPLPVTKHMMKNARDLGMAVVIQPDGGIRFEPLQHVKSVDQPAPKVKLEEEVTF